MGRRISTMTLIGLLIVLVIIAGLLLSLSRVSKENQILSISSFADCTAAGYPIMESYPEQCRTPDGRLFVNETQVAPTAPSATTSSDSNPPVPAGVQQTY